MKDSEDSGSDELLIKIPTSIFEKKKEETSETSKETDAYSLFERINVHPVRVKRNTEHGWTEVQTLAFAEEGQRHKILALLDTPPLYNKLPDILKYIYKLGCDLDREKRYYAAVAVGELAARQPFLDLKERTILLWAKNDHLYIRASASIALSHMLEHQYSESDVLMLLKHWVTNPNLLLADTALSTYYWIAQSYPVETLDAIKTVLSKERILLYLKIVDIFERVYDFDPQLAIEHLYKWLTPVSNSTTCWMAGLLFLLIVRLDDITESPTTRQQAIEIVFNLWDNPKMPLHLEMQERTTLKMEVWAKETVVAWESGNPKIFESYRNLFYELYWKYQGQRRNRLEYYLKEWQKRRERERAYAARRGNIDERQKSISFTDLIPEQG